MFSALHPFQASWPWPAASLPYLSYCTCIVKVRVLVFDVSDDRTANSVLFAAPMGGFNFGFSHCLRVIVSVK